MGWKEQDHEHVGVTNYTHTKTRTIFKEKIWQRLPPTKVVANKTSSTKHQTRAIESQLGRVNATCTQVMTLINLRTFKLT
jgi:hypothetical protein